MVPVHGASQVISDPQTAKTQPVKVQSSKWSTTQRIKIQPDLHGARFNNHQQCQEIFKLLFPNSFDCIGDIKRPVQHHGRPQQFLLYNMADRKFPFSTEKKSKRSWEKWSGRESSPTRWRPHHRISSLTYPKKTNGKLRICLDPKDLNKAIICENLQGSNPQGDSPCPHRSHKIFQGGWQQSFLWYAFDRRSLTPHNVQHPPREIQIPMCPIWTQNEP